MDIDLEIEDYVGGGGTENYNKLINKPQINGIELEGNKTLEELGITKDIISESENNGYIKINETDVKVYEPEPVDDELSETSEHAIQNKTVAENLKKKAPVNSPSFTGVPTVPTATQGTKSGQAASTEFVIDAIVAALADVSGIGIAVVDELPDIGVENKLYMVPIKTQTMETDTIEVQNRFDEFMYVNGAWEYLGAGQIDLDGYVKAEDMVEITFDDIEQMFAESGGGKNAEV